MLSPYIRFQDFVHSMIFVAIFFNDCVSHFVQIKGHFFLDFQFFKDLEEEIDHTKGQ